MLQAVSPAARTWKHDLPTDSWNTAAWSPSRYNGPAHLKSVLQVKGSVVEA